MKKSEKIELRVDHTEKERLSKIAERRGQTISDVVRDALAGELGVAPQPYPKWPGVAAIGAIVLAAGSLIWTAASPSASAVEAQVFSETQLGYIGVVYQLPNFEKRRDPVETSLPIEDGYGRTFEFTVDDASYRLAVSSEEGDSEFLKYDVKVCRVSGAACDDMQISGFDIGLRQAITQTSSVLSAAGPDGETIEVRLIVPPVKKAEAKSVGNESS